MDMRDDVTQSKAAKPYSKPELVEFGTVTDLTRSTTQGAIADGGPSKTSVV